jgi:hypothetical protein
MDPAPDPAVLVSNLQDTIKKYFFSLKFFCLFLFEVTFTSFFKKIKSQKQVTEQRNQGFLHFFADVDERTWSRIHTNKLWIRMRIQEAQKHIGSKLSYEAEL